ncbi:efflux RND transporter periplasmic adaptor subunit [Tropicimonas sp. S265A]|uniref:efflux RND transporter periplasmic adaptor subunit n=1 Tax=Tropicimonas sp. S265A TaxID=3415134 RepID=UPI003C7C0F0D
MTEQEMPRHSVLRSALRRSLILTGTGMTLALAVGLVVVGSGLIAARAADTSVMSEQAPAAVALAPLELTSSYQIEARFTGPIEPARSTELGFEPGGTLADILVDEGDSVDEGQTLARLDIRALQAERASQEATLKAAVARRDIAKLTADRQGELAARDFASSQRADEARFQLAVTEADIARAVAALEAIDISIAKSELTAPYAGVITDRHVDQGARLAPSQAILGLQDRVSVLRVGLPEDLSDRLRPGNQVDVALSSGTVTGRVARVRPDLDPATRTRSVLIALPEDVAPVTGTLAALTLTRTVQNDGAWVPMSALSEGIDGLWTIFVLPDGTDVIQRAAVTLEHIAGDRVYVAGALPGNAQVVTVGTHRLSPGQHVSGAGES